ncbi:hypothetical protein [Nocardia yamanashiensis]|uniref:hypothetical protein n=1 Tax=Nocardia yamanashiensis TaxID=209247 RepID=UPI0008306CF7|nr:hypothetical protein [Nocardia yamanashiensis]
MLSAVLPAMPAISAPTAAAELTGIQVLAGPEGILTGCPYTIAASVTTPPNVPGAVTFYDHATQIPGFGDYHPDTRTVTTTWTPSWKGEHMIAAIQLEPGGLASGRGIPFQVVGDGLNTGSSCIRLS